MPTQVKVASAVLPGDTAWRGWTLSEGERESLLPPLLLFAGEGWWARADQGSRSSWEKEINECADALPFY